MIESLINSYKETTYTTYNPKIEIIIGENSNALNLYLKKIDEKLWAFITAENPRSRPFSKENNSLRNQALETSLIKKNIHYLKGLGIPKDKNWEPENSFLIVGVNKKSAEEIAITFEQNAFVYGEYNKTPELVYGYLHQSR